jgi:hypothetical protein
VLQRVMLRASRNRFTSFVLVMATCALAISAHAQVYKCGDSAGKTVYSGQPCEYGGKPLPLSDNTIQGERPPADTYGTLSSGPTASGMSAECVQAQRALLEQTSKPTPKGIADAYRQRGDVKQLSKQVELLCGGGSADTQRPPPKPKRQPAIGPNPYAGQPSTLCPDGTYVRGTTCQICPDGSFVSGGSGCQITPKGTFVQGGKPATMCPDGSYVEGRCRLGPNGKYYGE